MRPHGVSEGIGHATPTRRNGVLDKSQVRLFSPNGNPRAENLGAALAVLQWFGRIRLAAKSDRQLGLGAYRPIGRQKAQVRKV